MPEPLRATTTLCGGTASVVVVGALVVLVVDFEEWFPTLEATMAITAARTTTATATPARSPTRERRSGLNRPWRSGSDHRCARCDVLDLGPVAADHHLGQLFERGVLYVAVDGDAAALHHVDPVAELEEVGIVVVDDDDRHFPARGELLHEVDDEP